MRHVDFEPGGVDRVADQHLTSQVAQQRGAQHDDDREAFHHLEQQRAAEHDQRDRQAQADDQQHQLAAFGALLRSGGHGHHVVERHHQVGDQDGADGGPDIVLAVVAFLVVIAGQQLHADVDQQHGADDLEVRQAQQLDRGHGQHHAHDDGGGAAPEDGLLLLGGRQVARGERDHHRVVAGQDDIGQDDRSQRNPECGGRQQFHGRAPRFF
ncbi:hypothetical protein D9M72_449830 [compost metagenome]